MIRHVFLFDTWMVVHVGDVLLYGYFYLLYMKMKHLFEINTNKSHKNPINIVSHGWNKHVDFKPMVETINISRLGYRLVATDPLVTRLQSFGKEHFVCPSSSGFRRVQQETLRLVVECNVYIYINIYIYIYIYIYGTGPGPWGPPPPPPNGMGPKPTFWLHFHGTRQNTWYLQCFDELGLRNRGICSVL